MINLRRILIGVLMGLVAVTSTMSHADSLRTQIIGYWRYDGFFYNGNRYPLPDPNLVLAFSFFEDGTSQLRWQRGGEEAFCERHSLYAVGEIDSQLHQTVTWTNPNNDSSCAKDTDMQIGRETLNGFDFSIENGVEYLNLHLFLDDKPLFYKLKRITNEEAHGIPFEPFQP